MPRDTLHNPHRPPVKAPSLPQKPRFWSFIGVWGTYSGPMTRPGAWAEWVEYFLTPLYRLGLRLFIVNLPWGVDQRNSGGYQFDESLYRSGTWVTEFQPAFLAWRKAHPDATIMFYLGSLNSLWTDAQGKTIPVTDASKADAIKKIDEVMTLVSPVCDSVAIDGSASANPNDTSYNGIFAWYAQQIDRIRQKVPVVLEALPVASNTWAHSFPWICNAPDYDGLKDNPNVEHRDFGQERIIIARTTADFSDVKPIVEYMKGYVAQGLSVAWPFASAYFVDAKKPMAPILGLFK